jgi:hypothetical protein
MNEQRENPDERDRKYAEEIGKRSRWPIGDTNEGTGTLEPSDDIGTGGTADVAGARDSGDTSSIRTGNIGVGGVIGTRLGDVGPATGAGGLSQQERGGLDALAEERSSADLESGSPVERGPLDRAEERVDTSAAGSLNSAAVQAAGLVGHSEDELPGTDDLGAAGGKDLGAGLGRTRGKARQNPRGQITGVGGTRGSGAGTGHLDDKSG